jgi:hypothetical protein
MRLLVHIHPYMRIFTQQVCIRVLLVRQLHHLQHCGSGFYVMFPILDFGMGTSFLGSYRLLHIRIVHPQKTNRDAALPLQQIQLDQNGMHCDCELTVCKTVMSNLSDQIVGSICRYRRVYLFIVTLVCSWVALFWQ